MVFPVQKELFFLRVGSHKFNRIAEFGIATPEVGGNDLIQPLGAKYGQWNLPFMEVKGGDYPHQP